MNLKDYHKKTIDDGIEIIICIGVHRYNITSIKISDRPIYYVGKEVGNEQGYMWFENIKEFHSWNNVKIFISSLR